MASASSADARRQELIALFGRLNALHPALTWDDDGLLVPLQTKKRKGAVQDWIRYLAGGWFETLVFHWLGMAFPEEPREANIQISAANAGGQRELDILLVLNRRLWVLEVKADLPPESRAVAVSDQLLASSGAMGRVGRMLVLSPQFVSRLSPAARDAFSLNCQVRNVLCCLATSPESLAWSLGKRRNLLSEKEIAEFEGRPG